MHLAEVTVVHVLLAGLSLNQRRVVFHAHLKELSAQTKGLDTGPNVCRGRGNSSNVIPEPLQPGQFKERAGTFTLSPQNSK